ncbi:MAG TPA: hypothetical protein DDZ89_03835 [Clostridiales bacterium]|nr:hypothetical protein [Clostridiales bacterium]
MKTIKIEIEIPEAFARYIDVQDPNYQRRVQELLCYGLIQENKISFGKAAEILGIDKLSLITNLGKLGIPYFDYDIDEVKRDALNASRVMEENR